MLQTKNRAAPLMAALALSTALLLAGCTPNPTGVASVDGGSAPSARADPDPGSEAPDGVRFAECMREHGVDVPDPEQRSGGAVQFALPRDADSSALGEAMEACKEFLPNGGEPVKLDPEQLAEARRFSACMREHGIEDFPDPNPDGGIMIEGDALDVDDEFQAAQAACAEHLPLGGEDAGGTPGGAP